MKETARILLDTYAQQKNITQADVPAFEQIFVTGASFRDKWKAFEAWMAKYSDYKELEEYLFDILVAHFLSQGMEGQSDDYLDSPEWLAIEEESADKGSEWLNLFVYLEDCGLNDIKPELDDYLFNFLLVEEDDQQDEFEIYEPLLEMQALVEEPENIIISTLENIEQDVELGDLLPVFILYFAGIQKQIPTLSPVRNALLSATWKAHEVLLRKK